MPRNPGAAVARGNRECSAGPRAVRQLPYHDRRLGDLMDTNSGLRTQGPSMLRNRHRSEGAVSVALIMTPSRCAGDLGERPGRKDSVLSCEEMGW